MTEHLHLGATGFYYYLGDRIMLCARVVKRFFKDAGEDICIRVERCPFKGSIRFRFDGSTIFHGTEYFVLTHQAEEMLRGYPSAIYVKVTNATQTE